jgi:hypothetical protein
VSYSCGLTLVLPLLAVTVMDESEPGFGTLRLSFRSSGAA